jgi:lactoylglutathione lyase
MKFTMTHTNINVADMARSIAFYEAALGMRELRSHSAQDGSFRIVFMGDGASSHLLELTWLRSKKEPYNLGDNESHVAFTVDDYTAAHALHEKMGCICYENKAMGLYFIEDPDGYWIEIVPAK